MQIEELRGLEQDWDTYGGFPPTIHALTKAEELVRDVDRMFSHVAGDRIVPYFIGPLPNGGVTLEWRADGNELGIDIGPDGQLGYLLVQQTASGRTFHEKDGAPWSEIADLLSQILVHG